MLTNICDAHSHVYGPYTRFPLASGRAFDPPEAPLEELEALWDALGIQRAVLVQGSAFGADHRALTHAISRSPESRRGVGILPADFTDQDLEQLDSAGLRAARVNWVKHLNRGEDAGQISTPSDVARVADRIHGLGWHVEMHIDADMLDTAEELIKNTSGTLVIDHMARLDASLGLEQPRFQQLRRLLDHKNVWVKLSGADRLCRRCPSLEQAIPFMEIIGQQAPDRCVWGLDSPHVNLAAPRSDASLYQLFEDAIPDEGLRRKILVENPARLYRFNN